jgi:murein DD-endopeptidase MepM/ murein hydrolase activator NlpD
MSIEKNILRILEEINESQKSMLQSIVLNEATTLSPPLSKLRVTSPFGSRWGRQHSGVDLAANSENVKSPADGIVTYTADDEGPCGGTIKIKHSNGYTTGYCHIQRIDVKIGQRVKEGDVIGISGGGINDPGRGRSDGPHLHFTLKKDDVPIDPMKYIGKEDITLTSDSNFDFLPSLDNDSVSLSRNSVIDDIYNNQEEFEFGGFKKNVKENITRIKNLL